MGNITVNERAVRHLDDIITMRQREIYTTLFDLEEEKKILRHEKEKLLMRGFVESYQSE